MRPKISRKKYILTLLIHPTPSCICGIFNQSVCKEQKNRASSWSAKIFLILISSLLHHQMNQFCGVLLLSSLYFMLFPTPRTLGTALVLFCCCEVLSCWCCWGTGYSRALLFPALHGESGRSHPSKLQGANIWRDSGVNQEMKSSACLVTSENPVRCLHADFIYTYIL